ncbi:MAG: signal peptidase II [Flavobacteriaceae bacterium]|nr:signal peptidase II [Flavobacteriaceae bacterium]
MNLKHIVLVCLLIILNIGCDQISKKMVRDQVEPRSTTEIIGEKFILTNVENSGAFLGMGSDLNPTVKTILLLILPVIVLLLVLRYVLVKKDLDNLTVIGLSFILGGGIGNLYDRILYGSVTDFFHIDLGGVFRTGIFNMADVSVMVGMGFILLASLVQRKKTQMNA